MRALAPWFGGARRVAGLVGEALRGLKWVGVPFCGGLSELAEIRASCIVANDLHRHIVHLARCVADPDLCRGLMRRVTRVPFHPEILESAQELCRSRVVPNGSAWDLDLAAAYFVCSWMGRSGRAGLNNEFDSKIATRWNTNGGGSNVRYRSAVRSLAAWSRILRAVDFRCMCAFDFLGKCDDRAEHGVYCDPPWPDDGDGYAHRFGEHEQRKLAEVLSRFERARIVVRYGEHPLIRELYPESSWQWLPVAGRNQRNNLTPEVLIVRRPAVAAGIRGLFDGAGVTPPATHCKVGDS